ncbi:hypothetical protein [Sphingomonas glaciei]|uniref:Uncharacterized protein n=1 Tax=Sphingomonas glaciei TaxID=2938948 RepID=A0ABY5MT05_9SPHN|nr:hypothetical protein [Sphingomonas glaciei]UUR07557.1 hypothetical protein M1K48_11515 [Sphingomonas glaciei]
MSQALLLNPPRPVADFGRLFLAVAFFAFCYCLLTWRALLLSEAAPLISDRRAIALLVGASAFWLALGHLGKPGRLTLVRTASWIVLGTIVVMVARLAVNWWKPDAVLTLSYSLRWSLAWAGYFGLWLMGAATFRKRAAAAVPAARDAEWEHIEWVIESLMSELEVASHEDRARLADRLIIKAGTYEMADEIGLAAAHNARLRLAYRIAARLTAEPR